MASDTLFAPFEAARKAHLVKPTGGLGGELWDLRDDISDTFERLDVVLGAQTNKNPVRLATAAALNAQTASGTGAGKTLTQVVAAVENIDGVAPVVGNRVLVKNQVAADDNGIYTVTTVGTGVIPQVLTRAVDFDDDADVVGGVEIRVEEGAANADTKWLLTTNNPIVVDTTSLAFALSAPTRTVDKRVRRATAAALGACTPTGSGVGKILTQNVGAVENIDGTAVVVGDRVLVKDQVAPEDNGIYTVTVVGDAVPTQQVLTRAADADETADLPPNTAVWVSEGTANADTIWQLTTDAPIVLDTTGLVFAEPIPVEHAILHIPGAGDALATAAAVAIKAANAEGTGVAFARNDHTHAVTDLLSHEGAVACAMIIQSGQPVAGQILQIGGDSYTAVVPGPVGAFEFEVDAGLAATTFTNLLATIVADGTENIFADLIDPLHIRLRSADGPQGTIIPISPNIALTEDLASYIFDCGNVNMNTLAGGTAGARETSVQSLTINAGHVAAGELRFSFPFVVANFHVQIRSAAGVIKGAAVDTFVINNGDILVGLIGGGADIAQTDIVTVIGFPA